MKTKGIMMILVFFVAGISLMRSTYAEDNVLGNLLTELQNKISILKAQGVQISNVEARFEELKFAAENPMPLCMDSSIDLRTVPIGFKCQTYNGAVFERVERESFIEAWQAPNGFVWSELMRQSTNNIVKLKYNQISTEAKQICGKKGAWLPDNNDFLKAHEYGAYEVLPGSGSYVWTSTSHPRHSDIVYIFREIFGRIDDTMERDYLNQIRCIGYKQ